MSDDSTFHLLDQIERDGRRGEVNVVSLLMEEFSLTAIEARNIIGQWIERRAEKNRAR